MNAPDPLFTERRAANPLECAITDNTELVKALLTRVEALEAGHAANRSDTQEILEVLHAAKGGFKVLGVMATFLKYMTMIGAFALFIWGLVHPTDSIKSPLK